MNRLYKVIWSYATHSWVVTSEIAKSRSKGKSLHTTNARHSNFKVPLSLLAVCLSFAFSSSAYAGIGFDKMQTSLSESTGEMVNYAINGGTAKYESKSSDGSATQVLNYYNPGNLSYADPVKLNSDKKFENVHSPANSTVGAEAIAIGRYANAEDEKTKGASGIAIGDYSKAVKGLTVALGGFAQATNVSSVAIGASSLASGFNSLAMMRQSAATNDYALAIGAASWASGKGSFAVGHSSTASGNQSIAIGSSDVSELTEKDNQGNLKPVTKYDVNTSTQATAKNAIAIGSNARATANDTIAIGTKSKSSNVNTTAIGFNASASGINATAIGKNSIASAPHTIAIGDKSKSSANETVALGFNSSATAQNSVALGSDTTASGVSSLAVGIGANATNDSAVAVGNDSNATGNSSVAIGESSNATGDYSTALGDTSTASGYRSIALAIDSNATGNSSVALGDKANATAENATAIGTYAKAEGSNSVALGRNTITKNNSSVAIGDNAKSLGNRSIAMGDTTNATVNDDIAIGSYAKTNTKENLKGSNGGTIAIGVHAKADGDNALAIGNNATAESASSIAFGGIASGVGATNIGYQGNTTGYGSISIGYYVKSIGNYSTAIGGQAKAEKTLATAIGANASASEDYTTALGASANATQQYSVALGANSATDSNATSEESATVNNITYSGFEGQVNDDGYQVSVGSSTIKRQIKNVAAGNISASSTDAINGSQLYITQQVLGNVANSVKTVLGGNAFVAPTGVISMSNIGNTGKGTVHDAIAAVKETVIAGTNVNVTSSVATNGSTTYTVNAWNTTLKPGSAEVNVTSQVNNANRTLGYIVDLSSSAKNNITTANVTAHNANTTVNKGWNITTSKSAGNVNGTNVSNVKMGDTVTIDAGRNINITQNGTKISIATSDRPTFTTVAVGNTTITNEGIIIKPYVTDNASKIVSLTHTGLNNGNYTITNVRAGLNGTDAVNVNQLKRVNATANAGWKLTVNGNNLTTVTPNATVDLANTDGNIVITKNANNVSFALNNNLTIGGKNGKDGEIGVKGANGKTGVTLDGKDGSIGINGKDGANGTITVKNGQPGLDGKPGENKTRIIYETTKNGKTTIEEIATLNDGLKFVGDKGEVIAKKLNQTLTIKGNLDTNANVTDRNLRVDNENGNLIVKMAKSLTDLTSATFASSNSNATIGGNGLTITPNAGNTVSLTDKGLNNGNNQITNVTSGLVGRDGNKVNLANATGYVLTNAVNVGDLKDSVNNLTNATTGGFGLKDSTGKEVKQDLGTSIKVTGKGGVNAQVVKDGNGKALQIGLNSTVTVGNDKEAGTITVKGKNGKDGVSINGKDGSIGINGKDGANGTITVKNGQPGLDGKPGENKTRIVYETTKNGKTTTEEIATLNDGLKFVGDKGEVIAKKLNQTLTIKGNLDTNANVTDRNLRVDNVNGELIIKMAKSLKDLTDATFTNATTGNKSVVNGNGLTITPKNGGTVSLTTKGLDNGGNKVVNVADGDVNATSKDAVNGSQLYAVREVVNKGWNLQTNSGKAENVKPGDTVNFVQGKNIVISNNGKNVTVGLAKDVDLGKDGSIKTGNTVMNNDGVKVGDKVLLTKDGLIAGDVKISAETGINAGNKRITNVASGLGGTKLADAKGDTLKNAANIGDLQMAISSVTDAKQGGGFGLADDKGNEVKQSLGKTIQVKGDGNVKTTVTGNSLTVGLNKDVDLGKDGSLTIGKVKVKADGINAGGNKVTGVKDGDISPTSTQAINGSQLYTANQNMANYLGGSSTVDANGNVTAPKYTITNTDGFTATANNVGDAINSLNNEVIKPLIFAGDTGTASKRKLGSTVTIKGGVTNESKLSDNNIGVVSDGNGALTVKLAKNLNVDSVNAKEVTANTVKAGDTTINSDGVKIVNGPSITKSGIDAAGNKITNVKAGEADTDAVNVSQLKAATGNVHNRINKVNKQLRAGIAGANAAAGLPQVYVSGKSMVAAAASTFKGESALAVGYSRSSDNGKVILKLQGNANTRGDLGGSVGVGYQW